MRNPMMPRQTLILGVKPLVVGNHTALGYATNWASAWIHAIWAFQPPWNGHRHAGWMASAVTAAKCDARRISWNPIGNFRGHRTGESQSEAHMQK
jgi:hypothetical protein